MTMNLDVVLLPIQPRSQNANVPSFPLNLLPKMNSSGTRHSVTQLTHPPTFQHYHEKNPNCRFRFQLSELRHVDSFENFPVIFARGSIGDMNFVID